MENIPPSHWQQMLIMSLIGAFIVLTGGMMAGRAGRAPFWSLLLLIPYVQIVALWAFAFMPWPRIDDADKNTDPVS